MPPEGRIPDYTESRPTPIGGLSWHDLALIRAWIDQGAPPYTGSGAKCLCAADSDGGAIPPECIPPGSDAGVDASDGSDGALGDTATDGADAGGDAADVGSDGG
jgi:hypothetical protein